MKTKTRFLAAFALMGSLFVASCGEQSQHQLMIGYPAQGYSILHADEVEDSIMFLTYDSWKVASYQTDWMRVDGNDHGNIKHDDTKRYWITVFLAFLPNTTNPSRLGTMSVRSYEYEVGARYLQYGHLDISRPVAEVEKFMSGSTIPDSVSFCLTDSASISTDSLCFRVQNRWTLEFVGEQPEWVKPDAFEGRAGRNRVNLTFEANPDTTARRAVLRLTSGKGDYAVSNDINIVQKGRKKGDNE